MVEQLAIAPKEILKSMVVLIRSLDDDEACYHAVVSSILRPHVFQTDFHSSSVLLERVLIKGVVPVRVEVLKTSYLGELKLSKVGESLLVVELFEEKEQEAVLERLCPMT
jgi:hypothetical protein